MAGYNGDVSWQIQPLDANNNSNLAGAFWGFRQNSLKSVNDPLRYQVMWSGSGVNEGVEPSAANFSNNKGDIVNVLFKVEVDVSNGNFQELGTIKKSRDILSKRYNNDTPAGGHRFTVDISQLVSNELSYSLCPINKGTWQSNEYGGMNGGLTVQDNVINNGAVNGYPISSFNITNNGTFRRLRVTPSFEVINATGEIVSGGSMPHSNYITVINSVNQFEKDSLYYALSYRIANSTSGNKFSFLSRCPNFTESGTTTTYDFQKPIRIDEQAEFLQFFIQETFTVGQDAGAIGLKVETFTADGSAENTFYLRDFEDNLKTDSSATLIGVKMLQNYQGLMCIQNVSPHYINNTSTLKNSTTSRTSFPYWTAYSGGKITASTSYYRVSMSKFKLASSYTETRATKFRYFKIDREDEKIPYNFVRFHWLNSLGGIDSYTAKKDIIEGLTISRDVIERKSGDRTWYQDDQIGGTDISPNSLYISDTMRGGDIYKGGRQVSNVNAERNKSVYTEPLNKSMAKWLEEMMLSPNVWIEMDTEATAMGNSRNPYLRPSDKEYIPVIITNSGVETVNQEQGLVKFNIEYTLAHKVITQRN
tara:strand:- start:970 stop:2739 length:1770 start_codon:yes stop_codon:yes gene_type:complete